ncbi:MAG: RICIN domain-containing protein [Reinekea sp.]
MGVMFALSSCSPMDESTEETKAVHNSATALLATTKCTAMPVSGHKYAIVNYGSGKAVDVEKKSTTNGANIIQWQANGGANQSFSVTDLGNGYWSIIASHSGRSLDVWGWSQSNGAPIKQYDYHGGINQQWQLKQASTGAFNVVSRYSGKSLTVGSSNNGAQIYQNDDAGNSSQRWYFNPLDGNCNNSDDGSSNDPDRDTGLIGFAAQSGSDGLSTTTGGGNASPITVNSCSALKSALSSSDAAVIQIAANTTIDCRTSNRSVQACQIQCPSYLGETNKSIFRVPVGNQTCTELGSTSNSTVTRTRNETKLVVKSNKTLEGMGANSKIVGGSLYMRDASNVIIRNLAIENVNPGLIEAGDGISMYNASHVWVDHVLFRLISDGHIDMYDSRNVTLSWNRFNGANPQYCGGKHAYTQIISDSHVTEHHNDYLNVYGRNPKVSGSDSRVHIFNSLWKDVPYFAIGVSDGAQVKVEGNYFDNASKPHWDSGNGYIDADRNVYRGSSASDSDRDSNATLFTDLNLYKYSLENADDVPSIVKNGVGPR